MVDTSTYQRTFDFHDGSHWQPDAGPLDVGKIADASTVYQPHSSGRIGPILCWKATQSTKYVDPTFKELRAKFLDEFDICYWYHWLSGTTPPISQAGHYLQTIGPWVEGERCMIDAEEAGIDVAGVVAFAERVEATTRTPCSVYTGLYVAGGTIWRSPAVRNSAYGPRPMHLAAYISRADLLKRMTQLGVIDLPMHFWQYSSNGPVPGVTGRADMNHVCDWTILGASASTPPTPTPTPPSTNVQEDIMYLSNASPMSINGGDFSPGQVWVELLPGGYGRPVTTMLDVRAALGGTEADCVNNLSARRDNAIIERLLNNPPPSGSGQMPPGTYDVVLNIPGVPGLGTGTATAR